MQWGRVLASFENAASSVHALLLGVTDWQAPGLGEWDIAGLGRHLTRAVSAPERYLELQEPVAAQVENAAGYFAAYLERRAEAPADLDATVASRALDGVDEPSTIPVEFGATLERAMLLLDEVEPSRLVPTPFGAMRMGNYLRTRTFELVVDGFDLGHALGVVWEAPAGAATDALAVIGDFAVITGRSGDLLGLVTGRSWADPSALPLLQ